MTLEIEYYAPESGIYTFCETDGLRRSSDKTWLMKKKKNEPKKGHVIYIDRDQPLCSSKKTSETAQKAVVKHGFLMQQHVLSDSSKSDEPICCPRKRQLRTVSSRMLSGI